jgi:hypothetical protein
VHGLSQALKRLIVTAAGVGIAAGVLILVFIAWWIAALGVAGLLAFAGVRRLLGHRRSPAPDRRDGTGPAVIEGEYREEPEALPDRRGGSPPR